MIKNWWKNFRVFYFIENLKWILRNLVGRWEKIQWNECFATTTAFELSHSNFSTKNVLFSRNSYYILKYWNKAKPPQPYNHENSISKTNIRSMWKRKLLNQLAPHMYIINYFLFLYRRGEHRIHTLYSVHCKVSKT